MVVANSTTPVAVAVAACFKLSKAAEAVEAPVPPCAIAISVAAQVPVAIVPIAVILVCEAVNIVPVIPPVTLILCEKSNSSLLASHNIEASVEAVSYTHLTLPTTPYV